MLWFKVLIQLKFNGFTGQQRVSTDTPTKFLITTSLVYATNNVIGIW